MSLQSNLGALENADLIRLAAATPDLAYLFRHALIQDAAYATLLRGQRQHWHLAAAEVLEGSLAAGEPAADLAPILAYHFERGGQEARALIYLVQAADLAFDRYANPEAIAFYAQALELATRPAAAHDPKLVRHLYSRRGRALELTSQLEAALDNYRAMEATARQRDDPALELAALVGRANIHATANFTQDSEQSAQLLERARVLANQLDDGAVEAKISWTLLLNNATSGGDPEVGIRYGERAMTLARALGQRELLVFILNDLWLAYAGAGQWDRAGALLDEGRALCQELGNLPALCENWTRSGLVRLVGGDYSSALSCFDQAYQAAEDSHSDDLRGLSHALTGLIHMDRGDLGRAIAIGEAAVKLAETTGNVTVLIGTRAEVGRAYGLSGDIERGLALAQQALDDSRHFELMAPWPIATQVRLHLMRGNQEQAGAALAKLDDFRQLRRRLGFMPFLWGNGGLAQIETALARGEPALALDVAGELIARLRQDGNRYLMPEALLYRAQALRALGRRGEAQAELENARQGAEALGSRRLQWPILGALAEMALEAGALETANDLRQQARQVIDYIAGYTPTPELRAAFLNRHDIRSLLEAGS